MMISLLKQNKRAIYSFTLNCFFVPLKYSFYRKALLQWGDTLQDL